MFLQVDGATAYVYTGGRSIHPSAPGVLFVHGAGLDHTVWTLPGRHFVRHGFNVLSVDLPGHGRSDGPLRQSIPDMAAWVAAVIEASGLETVALVGHSMGSLVALETAASYSSRIRSLALLGTAMPMPVTDELLEAARSNDHSAIDMLTLWGYSKPAQLGGNDTPGMWMLGTTMRLFERSGPGVIYNDLKACNDYDHGLESAAGVSCPTLLICGDRDIMTPPLRAREVDGAIADSRLLMLKGSGHTMMSEQPDAVLDALIEIVTTNT